MASQDRGRTFCSQCKAGGVAPGMRVDAVAVETDAEEDVHGRARWTLAMKEPWHWGSQAVECPPQLVLVA
jgi:hypothetical protein